MKKFYSTFLKTLVLTVLVAMPFAAKSALVGTIVPGGDPIVLNSNNQVYDYTPSQDGVLVVTMTPPSSIATWLYTGTDLETADFNAVNPSFVSTTENSKKFSYEVKKGTTYFFFGSQTFLGESFTFTFEFRPEGLKPEIANVYPTPTTKSQYRFFTYPEIQILFNMPGNVEFKGATLYYTTKDGNEATQALDYYEVNSGMRYDIDLKTAIMKVKSNMPDGLSEFTVVVEKPTIDGVPVTGQYVEDGNIVLNYLYKQFTTVTNLVMPDPFMSYWPVGDPKGKLIITFDNDLLPLDQQRISMAVLEGNQAPEDGTWGELAYPGGTVSITGNVLTVDFTGVQRVITDQSQVTINIVNVLDKNKDPIDFYGGEQFWYYGLPYTLIKELAPLPYEVTPMNCPLTDVESIEVYVFGEALEHVNISGFQFLQEGSETPLSTVNPAPVPDDFDPSNMIYNVPVPVEVQEASGNITLSAILETLDGYNYFLGANYSNPESGNSGVENLGADKAAEAIYTIEGLKVKGNVETLPAGLYIVGGKKMVICK